VKKDGVFLRHHSTLITSPARSTGLDFFNQFYILEQGFISNSNSKYMDAIIFLVGRILFGGFFLMNGINHLRMRKMLTGYTASKGVPYPALATIVSGLFILLGGAGIILGVYVKTSVTLIVIFLVLVTFVMHRFWKETDSNRKAIEMVNFMKNLALLGGALMILSIETWVYTLSF